jgi:hypothetical protein
LFAQSPLEAPVSLRVEDATLEEALYQLIEKEGVRLSFRNDQLPDQRVSLRVQEQPLRLVLDELLADTGLTYRLVGRQIILSPRPEPPPPKFFTLSGFITDIRSGERLIGASIYDQRSGRGVVANEYGFYSLTLPAGPVRLNISYLGYQPLQQELELAQSQRFNFALEGAITLQEVVVYAYDSLRMPIGGLADGNLIGLRETQLLPSLGGEPDVLRTAHLLPGVTTGTDGIEGLQVRGGDAGQNLVLIDGVPVYNVGHAIGLFSIFNPNVVRTAQLLRGGFPARYGGRLSGVLDIRTREGNLQRWQGSAETGLLTTRFALEGPLQRDRSSVLVSGRWSFLHFLLRPRSETLKADRGQEGRTDYRFYDFNAKINHIFSDRDRVYLSLYHGADRYADATRSLDTLTIGSSGNPFVYVVDQYFNEGVEWGNTVGALRWNHVFNDQLFANFSLTYSQLSVEANFAQRDSLTELTTGQVRYSFDRGVFRTGIEDLGLRADWQWVPHHRSEYRFGLGLNNRQFQPGVLQLNETDQPPEDPSSFINDPIPAVETYGYVEGQGEWDHGLSWNAGLHLASWRVRGRTYLSAQPRLSLAWDWNEQWRWTISGSRMTQFLHLLSNSSIGLPTDLWVPATEHIRPANAWLASTGWRYQWGDGWQVELDLYYKKMHHLLAFSEGASGFRDWENNVTSGDGEAFGAEWLLRRTRGRLTGWLAYALARSTRQFPLINFGNPYPFKYDRRHDLKVALVYRHRDWLHFSANWLLSSGFAFSIPLVKYRVVLPGIVLPGGAGIEVLDPGQKNQYRMPVYHRLDVNAHFEWGRGRTWQHALNVGVYNVYDRKNPLYYDVRRFYENQNNSLISVRQFVEVWIAPLIPTVSYRLSF